VVVSVLVVAGVEGVAVNISEYMLSDHFRLRELVPRLPYGNLTTTLTQLEVIRHNLGGKPIMVHSGYRSPEHNREVNGARTSQHLYGLAVDISVKGKTSFWLAGKLKAMQDDGLLIPGGLGTYQRHVHIDFRGKIVRWSG